MDIQHIVTPRRLLYFYKRLGDIFVSKRNGYDLSKNDYTDEEKTKLAGIETGAQANVIEIIAINGVPVVVTNKSAAIDLSSYALKSDLTNVYKFMGSVDTYAALASVAKVGGHVYNVKTADPANSISAGDNLAWNSTDNTWDNLHGIVDLSNYVTKDNLTAALAVYQLATDADITSIVV